MQMKILNISIGADKVNSVNATNLYKNLEVKTKYTQWIKRKIEKYGFIENQDYIIVETKKDGDNATLKDYIITLDMAKELAMVENNAKGREVRRYFIEVEKKANAQKTLFDVDGKKYVNVINGYKSQMVIKNKVIKGLKSEIEVLKSKDCAKYILMLEQENKTLLAHVEYQDAKIAVALGIKETIIKELGKIDKIRKSTSFI